MHNADSTMQILTDIWGINEGFVALITKRTPADKLLRAEWFAWPSERGRIGRFLAAHIDRPNLYFTPYVFSSKSWAYADDRDRIVTRDRIAVDMDAAPPQGLVDALRPRWAWSTSPGRFQAVWALDKPLESGASVEARARGMAVAVEASDGVTAGQPKPLRVPGSIHDKGDGPVPGQVLWTQGPLTSVAHLPAPKPVHTPPRLDVISGPVGRGPSQWYRDRANDPDGPRHRVLARIVTEMTRRGYSPRDCFDTLRDTKANKWDDDARLAADIARTVGSAR